MNVSLRVDGETALRGALQQYAAGVRNGAEGGLGLAASFVATSLAKRTRQPHGRGAYPRLRGATEADALALAPYLERHVPETQFIGYLKKVARTSMVAIADHPMPHGLEYRHLALFEVGDGGTAELRRRLRYRNAGLAKRAWKWMGRAARGKTSASGLDGLAGVSRSRLGVALTDRLRYSRAALDGPGAIGDALAAAAGRLRGYLRQRLEKEARKAGLKA